MQNIRVNATNPLSIGVLLVDPIITHSYAKDTSKKIRAVKKIRGESGQHLASIPVYGYMKDPNDKKKWIVDEPAAAVVRRIFDLCIAGKGPMQIAKILTAEKLMVALAHTSQRDGKPMPDVLYNWNLNSVAKILERMEYLGCTVNFKTHTKSLKYKKRHENPKEDWVIFEDTQPAIIERGQWERVQELRQNKRRVTKIGRTSIFSGLVRCADCGAKLYYCTSRSYTSGSQDHFVCSNYKSNTGSCDIHFIREQVLYEQVLQCIQNSLHFVSVFREDFQQELLKQNADSQKAEIAKGRKMLSQAQVRIGEIDTLIKRIYEDNVLGKLPDARYIKLSEDYENEQQELLQLTTALEREIEADETQIVDMGKFFTLADKYADLAELSAPLLNELVSKILVHKPEKKWGRKHITIEVFFTFVGRIVIPARPLSAADSQEIA